MLKYTYRITLQTQLGDKPGRLDLHIQDCKVKGNLNVLGNALPCYGEIDAQGKCTLRGQLKTFMSVFDYTGEGYADNAKVRLDLTDGENQFRILGTSCSQEDPSLDG